MLGAAIAAGLAHAAETAIWDTANNTVTYSDNVAGVLANGAAKTVNLSQFDASDVAAAEGQSGTYTLTRVVLTVDGSLSGSFNFVNTSGGALNLYSASLAAGSRMKFTVGSQSASEYFSYTIPDIDIDNPYAIAGNTTYAPDFATSGPGAATRSITTDLASYIGSGQLATLINLTVLTSTVKDTGISDSVSASGAGTVSLQYFYDYTPVPEPTTLALLSFGCAALLVRRRKA